MIVMTIFIQTCLHQDISQCIVLKPSLIYLRTTEMNYICYLKLTLIILNILHDLPHHPIPKELSQQVVLLYFHHLKHNYNVSKSIDTEYGIVLKYLFDRYPP